MTGESDNIGQAPEQAPPSSAAGDGSEAAIMEIYAQEYRARNKVRELKKMRQYFQRDQRPGGGGQSEQVQKWVKERQQTDPCFLCGKLGHWSQERPLRKRAPIHASNVTFPGGEPNGREWDFLETLVSSQQTLRTYMALVSGMGQGSVNVNEICWSMQELGNKMIVHLGCMKTVVGTTWVNQLVKELRRQGRFVHVVREQEAFRFGDGHVSHSKFCVVVEVALATVHCLLQISVVSGNCPPLLSKAVYLDRARP